jgi:hypothetical protein
VALAEFFAFIVWLAGDEHFTAHERFTARSADAAGTFTDLFLMSLPVAAVLLATKLTPALDMARTIVTVALAEYGVAVVLGLITFLIGLGNAFDGNSSVFGIQTLVLGLGRLILIAIAGYYTYGQFTEMGGRLTPPSVTYNSPQYPGGGGPQYTPGSATPQYPGGGGYQPPGSGPSYPPPPSGPTYPPAGPSYPTSSGPTYPPSGGPSYPPPPSGPTYPPNPGR